MDKKLIRECKKLLRDVRRFSAVGSGIRLRTYQEQVAQAVVDSVIKEKGLSFVIMFPRQSGKNELQAQIETYLLALYSSSTDGDGQGFAHLEASIPQCHAPAGAGH